MGANVHVHFCMNEFSSWSFFEAKDSKCGKCGMDEKDQGGCCKDEHQHFKLDTDHQKTDVAQLQHYKFFPQIATPFTAHTFTPQVNITAALPASYAPPNIHKQRLHVLHCVFLI